MEFNSSLCCVSCADIKRAANSCIKWMQKYREKQKEESILFLMKPKRFLFWVTTKTRAEAEKEFESLYDFLYLPRCFYRAHYGGSEDILRCRKLISACDMCANKTMYLSVADTELIKNYL